MDNKVKPHEVLELLAVVAHHRAVVARVVEGQVLLDLSILELAPVDQRRHLGHLGDHVQDVFVRVLPVLLFTPGGKGNKQVSSATPGRSKRKETHITENVAQAADR